MHFGATLRFLRIESGLGLRDLARRLGVSGAYLSRVENGLDALPTPARIQAMAREMGIPASILLDLAHRISPLVVDYVERVPEAGSLFLEIAHRRLGPEQVAALRAFLDERFPRSTTEANSETPSLTRLLTPDRVVLGLQCTDIEDVFDVAAGRVADPSRPEELAWIAHALKQRETEVSGAIGGGVAVACAQHPAPSTRAALVTLAAPLPHETPDGERLRLVVVLAGGAGTTARRLLVARIAWLAAKGMAERLCSLRSALGLITTLATMESSLG